jgi:hypothetical protein
MWKVMFVSGIALLPPDITFAADDRDSSRFIQRIEIETRPEYIIRSNAFLKGENLAGKPFENAFSVHLKYSFQFNPNTLTGRIYGMPHQGLGLAYNNFGNRMELGNPTAFYLFQGAQVADFTPRLSLNYEWNFGLSAGWKPYDQFNPYNTTIGSKVNAYLNANFYLNWTLSQQFDLTSGITLAHFSNGNTNIPNAGLNTVGLKIGLIYNFNRNAVFITKPLSQSSVPLFPRHISYDLLLFGSWRRTGVFDGEKLVASPDTYTVLGFNFAPMYNFSYKFRAGVSLDGVYDKSANIFIPDYANGSPQVILSPSIDKQLALGLSARAEYVMPYFTVGLGVGMNVLHGGGNMKAFYQILALKTEITRNSFIHIGYSLKDYKNPNFLMLGIGYRFNNKYPTNHR